MFRPSMGRSVGRGTPARLSTVVKLSNDDQGSAVISQHAIVHVHGVDLLIRGHARWNATRKSRNS